MIDGVSVDVPHDADVVGDFVVPGDEAAHFLSAFSVFAKLGADGSRHWDGGLMGGHPGLAATCVGWKFLAVVLAEVGLVVEEFELGRTAGLKKVNDALGLGRDFRTAEDSVIGVVGEQGSKSHAADARGGLLEEVTTVNGEGVDGFGDHGMLSDNCRLLNGKCEGGFTKTGAFLAAGGRSADYADERRLVEGLY